MYVHEDVKPVLELELELELTLSHNIPISSQVSCLLVYFYGTNTVLRFLFSQFTLSKHQHYSTRENKSRDEQQPG